MDKIERRRADLLASPASLAEVLSSRASDAATRLLAPPSGGGLLAALQETFGGGRSGKSGGGEERDETARRVVVRGEWDHARSMLIGRRGAPDGLVGERPQGLATAPSGYFLCTVLKLSQDDARACGADGPKEVVVKRGWLPAAAAEAKQWTRPAGQVEVSCTSRAPLFGRGVLPFRIASCEAFAMIPTH